jgi:translocator protein
VAAAYAITDMWRTLRQSQWLWLVGFLAVSYGAAGVGSLFTINALKSGWYRELRKPQWTPPDRIFGPVWTILYTQMAIAAWLLRRRATKRPEAARLALVAWAAQLALNVFWSAAFFGARSPAKGLAVIVALWFAIAATLGAAARVQRAAAALLVPYFGWTTYAAALNLEIWRRNR